MAFLHLMTLVSSLAVASRGDSIPLPQLAQGEALLMTGAAVMGDGTWIVSELADRLWWTRNLGAKWERIPGVPVGGSGRIFGDVVLSNDNKWFWTFDGGWRKVAMPAVCTDPQTWTISPEGVIGVYDPDRKTVSYCRSTDGLRTWSEWFSLPKDTSGWLGEHWNGKVWYKIVDSGYMRGTDDGSNWTRVELPAGFLSSTFMPLSPASQRLVLLGGRTYSERNRVAISDDLGAHWVIRSAYDSGLMVRKLTDNLFFTVALDSAKRRKQWLSRAQEGPWTAVDADYQGVLFENDQPYVVERAAIFRLGLEGLSGRKVSAWRPWRVRQERGSLVVELPVFDAPRAWSLRTMEGRIIAEGKSVGGRLEFPGPRRGLLLLTVGERTSAIHWF